jgi:hypothetical protein
MYHELRFMILNIYLRQNLNNNDEDDNLKPVFPFGLLSMKIHENRIKYLYTQLCLDDETYKCDYWGGYVNKIDDSNKMDEDKLVICDDVMKRINEKYNYNDTLTEPCYFKPQ